MARIRCGPASGSLKLKWPPASALVRAASSIPSPSLISTTSSPPAGLLVVPFLRVPLRVWAEAEDSRSKAQRAIGKLAARLISIPQERDRARGLAQILREAKNASLRMTVTLVKSLKLGFLFSDSEIPQLVPVARFQPGWRPLLLPEKSSSPESRSRETFPPCIQS